MATVVPTKDAQEELVRLLHHEYGSHPHYRQQVYTMRQIVVWRGMAKMVKDYEKDVNATHGSRGPTTTTDRWSCSPGQWSLT